MIPPMKAACAIAAVVILTGSGQSNGRPDLVALFNEWRAFQKPKLVDGVADYTAAAMAAQQRELPAYQRRLAALDPGAWPVPQQVDWHIVRAEMNGLDFDHRVLRPWANDPAFSTGPNPSRGAEQCNARSFVLTGDQHTRSSSNG